MNSIQKPFTVFSKIKWYNKIDGDAPVMSLSADSILSLDTSKTPIVDTDEKLVVSAKYYVFFYFTKK